MVRNCSYHSTYPSADPLDRFKAIREAQLLLKQKGITCREVLKVLSKTEDGVLEFRLGAFILCFTRGLGVWPETRDTIQLSIEIQKDEADEVVAYEFDFNDLGLLDRLGEAAWKLKK